MNSFGNNASSWNAASATPGAYIEAQPGDLNNDGFVDDTDVSLIKSGFGSTYRLADLFAVRNNYAAAVAAAVVPAAAEEAQVATVVVAEVASPSTKANTPAEKTAADYTQSQAVTGNSNAKHSAGH